MNYPEPRPLRQMHRSAQLNAVFSPPACGGMKGGCFRRVEPFFGPGVIFFRRAGLCNFLWLLPPTLRGGGLPCVSPFLRRAGLSTRQRVCSIPPRCATPPKSGFCCHPSSLVFFPLTFPPCLYILLYNHHFSSRERNRETTTTSDHRDLCFH
jgi:hypothetical protein